MKGSNHFLATVLSWAALFLGQGAHLARAADTVAPTLNIQSTWIEKVGSVFHFKMMLDPADNVGVDHIEFRDALNTTNPPAASVAWATYPWTRGQAFDEGFICTALSLELRAVDAAGNPSPVQRRTFKAPFPLSTAPNLDPQFQVPPMYLSFVGATLDCKGLFTADFNGDGRDDTVQFDNATGLVKVRCQNSNGTFSSQLTTLTAGTIQDGAIADFDKDGKMDLIVVANHDVVEYHNDGNNVNSLPTFSAITPPGRSGSAISSVEHIAVGDVNGDGYPEAFIVGTGSSVAKAEVLANDGAGSLHGFTTALAPSGALPGRIVVGDLNGDGRPDLAMVDATVPIVHRVIVFQCLSNLVLGGQDDPTPANRPLVFTTARTADAIAIGDVTGDGLNDLVVTIPYYGPLQQAPFDDGQNHNAILWQIIASDPVSGLHALAQYDLLDASPPAASALTFSSDVMIRNYTGNRLPQIEITDEFNSAVKTVRLDVPLDNQNRINGIYTTSVKTFPVMAHPHRLTHARFGTHTRDDLVVAGGDTNQIGWLFNSYTSSSKANDIIGGANTDSDPNGTADTLGVLSYKVYPNGTVNYSLTYVNNTASAITGATVLITLPSTLVFLSGDAGNTVTTSGTSHIVSWTTDIPANSAGVRNLSAQVTTTVPNTLIAPAFALKKGATTLASGTMPKVTVTEPLLFQVNVSSDSDNTGLTVHTGEAMKYEFVVTNNSNVAITNVKFGTAFPAGTKYIVESTPPGGTSFVKRGVVGKETGIDWTTATLPAHGTVIVFVLVEVTGAELAIITESTATCTRGTTKIIPPAFKTTISRSLEIILTKDLAIARPGDFVNYQFSVHNWGKIALVNAQLVTLLPQGMALTSVKTDDGTGNFVSTPINGDTLTSGTNPAIDRSPGPTLSTLLWTWASFPKETVRTVRFTCQAMFDDPPYYIIYGTHVTNQVSINSYNFTGALATNTALKLYAAKPNLPVATTAALKLISSAVPSLGTPLSGGEPLAPPALTLNKSAVGDGLVTIAGESIATVVNDSTVSSDGVFTYVLTISNGMVRDPAFPDDPTKFVPGGTATNVQVRDFVPTGTTFLGFVTRDSSNVPSYSGFHFFNSANKEIDATIPANIPLVRSFTFPVGNLSGNTSTVFTYRVQTTLPPSAIPNIVSYSGGYSGKTSLYTFDSVTGYHLTASNLNFPTNGGPRQLKVLVTGPAVFNLPAGAIKSRGNLSGTESVTFAIPFEVLGGTGINLAGAKMEVPIPKGYTAFGAQLFDMTGSTVPGSTITKSTAGVSTVSFPIGNLRNATAMFQVQFDPATQSVLKNASGQIIAPLSIKPTVTGTYTKAAAPAPLAAALGASALLLTPVAIPPLTGFVGAVPALADPFTKDAKIFVGRCAPSVVRRGENLTFTIFVGNLTNLPLGLASVSMKIPAGTTYVSSTLYTYNGVVAGGGEVGATWSTKPVVSGGKITWNIGVLTRNEGGAMSVTVNVPATFSGNRIDDNSCIFDCTNAAGKTPGPIGIVVLNGNETAQGSAALQGVIEGTGATFTDEVRTTLNGFVLRSTSCTVTTGGCDTVRLDNDVVLIPLAPGSDRMMVLGPPSVIIANATRTVYSEPIIRILVGPGTVAGGMGLDVTALPGLGNAPLVTPNSIMLGMSTDHLVSTNGGNVVAQGAGNIVGHGSASIVSAGAGNIVDSGAGKLIGSDGAGLTGANAAKIILPEGNAAVLATSVGAKLIGDGGNTIVSAGAGNIVSHDGGTLTATGAGYLIGHDGASLSNQDGSGAVAAGAASLIGQDGSGVLAAGVGNIISATSGNLVNNNGVTSLANVK